MIFDLLQQIIDALERIRLELVLIRKLIESDESGRP